MLDSKNKYFNQNVDKSLHNLIFNRVGCDIFYKTFTNDYSVKLVANKNIYNIHIMINDIKYIDKITIYNNDYEYVIINKPELMMLNKYDNLYKLNNVFCGTTSTIKFTFSNRIYELFSAYHKQFNFLKNTKIHNDLIDIIKCHIDMKIKLSIYYQDYNNCQASIRFFQNLTISNTFTDTVIIKKNTSDVNFTTNLNINKVKFISFCFLENDNYIKILKYLRIIKTGAHYYEDSFKVLSYCDNKQLLLIKNTKNFTNIYNDNVYVAPVVIDDCYFISSGFDIYFNIEPKKKDIILYISIDIYK